MEGGFERFLDGFKARHPEWYGEYESARARERFQEAMAKVPADVPVATDGMDVDVAEAAGAVTAVMEAAPDEIPMFQDCEMAEEVRDEEAEAEEQAAVLSE